MKFIGKLISALLIGISLAFFYWIGSFVLSQSNSVFRNSGLDPSNLLVYVPAGIAIGAVVFWIIRKMVKSLLIISFVLFVLALLLWWLVSSPAVQQYIMPPMLK